MKYIFIYKVKNKEDNSCRDEYVMRQNKKQTENISK